MLFASRQEAGQRLGRFLREHGVAVDVVLGLPRGGVVVAAEVAGQLGLPLDVLIVRKIGHPLNREFAVGALAEPDVFILDKIVLRELPVSRSQLDEVVAEETLRLREHRSGFHRAEAPVLSNRRVLLGDDGLATGTTAEAAVLSARRQNARSVMVAVPVASVGAVEKLKPVADDVVALLVDPDFAAVGRYYQKIVQTTDDEVVALLNKAAAGNL
jgi:putative phosphoribosyl transferase